MPAESATPAPHPHPRQSWVADGKSWIRRIWRDVRYTDRIGTLQLRIGTRTARIAVWTAISGLYWIGWGQGIINAIVALINLLQGVPLPATFPARTVDANLDTLLRVSIEGCTAAVALACILLLTRARTPFTPRTALRAAPLSALAITAGFAATGIVTAAFALPENSYPPTADPDPLTRSADLASSFMAGPSEELVLLALPVIGLRAVGHRWRVIFLTAAALRVPFHLYYGPGAIALALWALLMVALVRRLGGWAVLGAIVEHSAWDVSTTLGLAPALIVKGALILCGAIIWFRWLRHFDPPKRVRVT